MITYNQIIDFPTDGKYNDLNFILSFSYEEINNIFSEANFFKYSIPEYEIKNCFMNFYPNLNDKRIVILQEGKTWIKFQDYCSIASFIITTNSSKIRFGYITGTHSPLIYTKGFTSASNINGYQLWVTNNFSNNQSVCLNEIEKEIDNEEIRNSRIEGLKYAYLLDNNKSLYEVTYNAAKISDFILNGNR